MIKDAIKDYKKRIETYSDQYDSIRITNYGYGVTTVMVTAYYGSGSVSSDDSRKQQKEAVIKFNPPNKMKWYRRRG